MTARRAAVLVSGSGRTALNLHDASRAGRMPAEIAVVVAHREDVPAVVRCRAAGLAVSVVAGAASDATSDALDIALARAGAEIVLLAGYLRMFRVGPWAGRTLNVHPALLPHFGGTGMHGRHVHEAVLASGARESGCTVHLVDDKYDHGRIVVQRRCPVLRGDTAESLASRVIEQESIAYPDAVALWSARC
jgi:formyltetrahydrofolate-dependent phosphoribosylglycinamide formyltransferase